MLTPEIKTNLILKEIGVKRYSLRKKKTDSLKKDIYYYQKGSILALLDKPFENFVENQQDLINAIMASTKCDEGNQESNVLSFSSSNELNKKIHNLSNFRLIIVFGNIINGVRINKDAILAPSINELGLKKNLKKNLWVEIKTKLDI
ncbi:MAG: hypothetical protein EVA97_02940 [SAR86 cluster bacterium]|uniref:Uncharacterized protein n=1 Tax=SAR86 cluster bacterium TaxID=2030880 RepID=A0A520N446_9GAMM|nr:MAG: hypothetical protein EVA97_02940 [SAR86 cluster bacterium]|tara:strand:- start:313 stop:753 length:441 start_codon:yes stop_codon:yes gene_type:complete